MGKEGSSFNIEIGGNRARYHMEKNSGDAKELLTLDVEPDGSVKAVVEEVDKDGNRTEMVYEAESMELFKKKYPDVAKRFNMDGMQLGFSMPDLNRMREPRLFLKDDLPVQRLPAPSLLGKGKTLGIYIDPDGPRPVLRTHLGLKEGEGVIVEQVLKGSFAWKIGLKPLDVIVSIKGKPVGSAREIRAILSDVKENEKVEIILFRNGKKETMSGKYTAPLESKRV
jgi:hypothetical protein